MYSLNFDKNAKDFLKKLDKPEQKRILDKLEQLKTNPELGKPLTGNLIGLWSLRIGDKRAIYQIFHDKLIVLVIKIGHRKNIYED
jgi:mRNA interferase RelE/StbE